jgi:uncharacterized Zn finger protein
MRNERSRGISPAAALATHLDRRALRQLAGARSFERGQDYFASGQVRAVAEDDGTLTAKVHGARLYRVRLWLDGGKVEYSCTCPMGNDGAFCKHCVAAGLAWLAGPSKQAAPPERKGKPTVSMDDARSYLAMQDKTALVELLMQHATENDRLRQQLLLRAARKSPKGLDVSTYRHAIAAAADTGDFVEYAAAHGYAQGITDVIDSIDELLREGYAGDVVELAEYALAAVEAAVESVDDSDGYMTGVLERLQQLHLAACKKARPDPEALAKRLCAWELRAEWDIFYGAVETYASILGRKGIAVYRQLAEAEWAKVPSLGAGRDEAGGYARRFRITQMMEALARQTGDVEAVVAIKKRDLSSAYAYLQIAETYAAARKRDLALEWAERGVKAFPERTDGRLREFLAQEYHRRKRHDEAMALIWAEFTDWPAVDRFRMLKDHAVRIGRWEIWRAKAIASLRESMSRGGTDTGNARWPRSRRTDRSELVRIFLWERKTNAAWSEAVEGGCSNDLWMDLASKREKVHPEDALPIYQRQIEPTLSRKNNDAYRAAIGFLRQIRALMVRLGREAEFARYLESVRAAHKAKRNFVKLLDHANWE